MLQMPKRVKFRKCQKGKIRGNATRGNTVAFGEYGIMALERCWLSARQIEAGRVAGSHCVGKDGKLYIRVFPWKPISKKPAETRMGHGKGEPEFYAAVIKPGMVLYEIAGVTSEFARQAMNLIAHKMPIKCKFVQRRHGL